MHRPVCKIVTAGIQELLQTTREETCDIKKQCCFITENLGPSKTSSPRYHITLMKHICVFERHMSHPAELLMPKREVGCSIIGSSGKC